MTGGDGAGRTPALDRQEGPTVILRSRGRLPESSALLVALALVVSLTVVVTSPSSPAEAAGTPDISLAKSGPGNVLIGEAAQFRLRASNPSGPGAAYNVTFRDVLPAGVSYVGGSVSPASAGEPTPYGPDAQGITTLVWLNVSDVQPGGSTEITYRVQVDTGTYPVGATFANAASVYANSDPRYVPKFDGAGVVISGPTSYTASDGPRSTTTTVSAIELTKAEPSPEHELVRGVHDDTTVYTLAVRNNNVHPTTDITVVDYLPAGLEFLVCGGVDNTPPAGNPAREYPGAPALTAVPVVASDCPAPSAVETVSLGAGEAGVGSAAGIYTRVAWTGITMATGETRTIKYRAGIPLQANTTDFPSGVPTPASGEQAANLENNTGASTRETLSELALTNYASAEGLYQGPGAGGAPAPIAVSDATDLTVTAEDLALHKSVSPGTFQNDGIATYTLTVRTGEYATAGDVVLTDLIPDGLCPVWGNQTPTVSGVALPDGCGAGHGANPTNATLSSVVANPDGTFAVQFASLDLVASGTVVVTYQALMRTDYTAPGVPTVAGDSFTNTVGLTGTTTTVPAVSTAQPGYTPRESGTQPVLDDSSATITSVGPAIDKRIGDSRLVTDCASATYIDTPTPASAPLYRDGDRVCFLLTVDFPGTVDTRNPVVTDFLPAGVAYESGSVVATTGNDVDFVVDASAAAAGGGGSLAFTIGTGSPPLFVNAGDTFQVRFSGVVVTDSGTSTPDITGNLMKFRSENTDGQAVSLRDQVDLRIAPAPPMSITKTASDTSPVAGQAVTYTVTPTNAGSAASGSDDAVSDIEVWDVLPTAAPGITCADVSAISTPPGGVPGACDAGTNTVKWTIPGPVAAGASAGALTYVVTFPMTVAAGSSFTNTAGVRTYTTSPNVGPATSHYPASNIDPTACGANPLPTCDVPSAKVNRTVTVPATTLDKSGTTSVTYPDPYANPPGGNDTPTQATIGEIVTYTVDVTVPARTSVFNGVLTDPLPTGLEYVDTTAVVTRSVNGAAGPFTDYTGAGEAAVSTTATSVTVTLPTTYADASASDSAHVLRLTFSARVTTAVANAQGVTRTNTSTFASKRSAGGANLTSRTDTYAITVVEPAPTLTKGRSPAGFVRAGQVLTYTLTAANPAGRAPLEHSVVVDCVPGSLLVVDGSIVASVGTATAVAGTGSNGCAVGQTRIGWDIGRIAGSPSPSLTYDVTVADGAVAGDTYSNTATLTGGTLSAGGATERTYTREASSDVIVDRGGIVKSVDPSVAAVGQPVTWTVTATLPEGVTYYDAAVIDTLPAQIAAGSLTTVAASCTNADSTPCSPALPFTPLAPADAGAGQTAVGWLLGTLASSQERTVVIEFTARVADVPASSLGATAVNSAQVSWNLSAKGSPSSAGADFDESNGPATATVTLREPLVSIAKEVSNATPNRGETVTYTVTVSADDTPGRSAAYAVSVEDAVPTGVVVTSVGQGGTVSGADPDTGGGTVTWTVAGPLAPGADAVLSYDARIAQAAPLGAPGLTNTVDIPSYSGWSSDGRTYDNVTPAEATVVVGESADLTLAKTHSGTPAIPYPFDFTLTVTNAGPSVARGPLVVVDTLPAGLTYVDASAGWSCGAVGQVVTCERAADLPAGASAVLGLTVLADGAGTYQNSAVVTSSTPDPVPANNDATDQVTVLNQADLSLVKTQTGGLFVGSSFGFTLAITNAGPSDAAGPLTVVDTWPAGLQFTTASAGWDCALTGGTVTCSRPEGLAAGDSVSLALSGPGTAPGPFTNSATVTSGTPDPDPGNNTDGVTGAVVPIPIPPAPEPEPAPEPTSESPAPAPSTTTTGPTSAPTPGPGSSTPPPASPAPKPTDVPEPAPDPTASSRLPQRPVKPIGLPSRINPYGRTRITSGWVVTNAGQRARVTVRCAPLAQTRSAGFLATVVDGMAPRGDVRYCQVSRKRNGAVYVTVLYPPPVRVTVTIWAPATGKYKAYKKVRTYVTRAR